MTWRNIFGVSKRVLLLLAGCVWCFAGAKVLNLGVPDMYHNWHLPILDLLTASLIFFLFYKMIFSKLVPKHLNRIQAYLHNKVCIFAFFDVKAYLIMIVMISGGICLRNAQLLEPVCIGTFYTGLGSVLFFSGLRFIKQYITYDKGVFEQQERQETALD